MPYKTEKMKLGSNFLDKRVKLLPCQKERIFDMYHKEGGYSQRVLAKMFKVSRRSIQFILDPDKLSKNKEKREERGGSMAYYDKDKHKDYMKNHRRRKNQILNPKQ